MQLTDARKKRGGLKTMSIKKQMIKQVRQNSNNA